MKLTDLGTIRDIMARHGVSFQKKFGQNFLISPTIPERIAEMATDMSASSGTSAMKTGVLEIGPGIGTLTRELSHHSDKVVALEIDTSLIPILGETLEDCANVKVINNDVLKTDLAQLCEEEFTSQGYSVCVAANLPYYITTPILMKLVESKLPLEKITVMVQKEVAARLCAAAGSADYGSITASLAFYGRCERLFLVPAGCFVPAPKVDSAVVQITMYKTPPVSVESEELLFRVIRGAFAQRRKTLANSLSSEFADISRDMLTDAIVTAGFDPLIRGERLSLEDFAKLSNILAEMRK